VLPKIAVYKRGQLKESLVTISVQVKVLKLVYTVDKRIEKIEQLSSHVIL